MVTIKSGPEAPPVNASLNACIIFPCGIPNRWVAFSSAEVAASLVSPSDFFISSFKAEMTAIASSFHFLEAIFSSKDFGAMKKIFPSSAMSFGKVMRSRRALAIALALPVSQSIPSVLSQQLEFDPAPHWFWRAGTVD